jgi:hypothetical protein
MMARPVDLEAYLDAVSAAADLDIPPACRQGVLAHLGVILEHCARMSAFPLCDDEEAATIFRP